MSGRNRAASDGMTFHWSGWLSTRLTPGSSATRSEPTDDSTIPQSRMPYTPCRVRQDGARRERRRSGLYRGSSAEAAGTRRNPPKTLSTHGTPAAEFGGFFGNVLRSWRDVRYRRFFSSHALSHDRTGRRYHRRLPAATSGPGSKPVACIGSFLGSSAGGILCLRRSLHGRKCLQPWCRT